MNSKLSNNFGLLNNDDQYLHSLRSSRLNIRSGLNPNFAITTSIKAPNNNKNKFTEDGSPESLKTQKKLIFTPFNKEEVNENENLNENESKQTVNNFNNNIFKNFQSSFTNNKNVNNWLLSNQDESNKENSNLLMNKSKVFSSDSSNEEREIHSESSFKIPRKSIFNEDNKNLFNSVRVNLQLSFNSSKGSISNNNFFDKNRENVLTTTLISSSSASSQSQQSQNESMNMSEDKRENKEDNEKKELVSSHQDNYLIQIEDSSQQSLVEGLNNKFNILVPQEKTNDEKYKLLALRKVRKFNFKDTKSVSNADILKCSTGSAATDQISNNLHLNNNFTSEGPQSMLEYNFFSEKRKKIAHSVKKLYASEVLFTNPVNQEKKAFKIYKDHEIGFGEYWQKFIRETKEDEDVPSDDELLQRAAKHNQDNLMEAFTQVMKEKKFDLVHNISFLNN
jgi:hypothetical protein